MSKRPLARLWGYLFSNPDPARRLTRRLELHPLEARTNPGALNLTATPTSQLVVIGDTAELFVTTDFLPDHQEGDFDAVGVNWGDGSSDPVLNWVPAEGGWVAHHTYETGGTFTPTVWSGSTRFDANGNVIAQASDSLTVSIHVQASAFHYSLYSDDNGNGELDPSEGGVPGATAQLLDEFGNPVGDPVTSPDGDFEFDDLRPGFYTIEFTTPAGYAPIDPISADLDPDETVTPPSGAVLPLSELDGEVFFDGDGDGEHDPEELGLMGVDVTLLDGVGLPVGATQTGSNGGYSFLGIPAGLYTVLITPPPGMALPPGGLPPVPVVAGGGNAPAAGAQLGGPWLVNTTQDTPDANPNDGVPRDANGLVSLRAAVQQANALRNPTLNFSIGFDPNIFSNQGPKVIVLNGSMDVFYANINVVGTSRDLITISGTQAAGMFTVEGASHSAFSNLTFQNGSNQMVAQAALGAGTGFGGAIDNRGWLAIADSRFKDCIGDQGGAVANHTAAKSLTVRDTEFIGNRGAHGGAILADGGMVTLTNSDLTYNQASARGGAIALRNNPTVDVTDCLIAHNQASWGGGVYNSGGTYTMTRGLLQANRTTVVAGGGLFQSGGSSAFTDTTLDSNVAADVGGAAYIVGGTLDMATCAFVNNQAGNGGAWIARKGVAPAVQITLTGCVGINPNTDIYDDPN